MPHTILLADDSVTIQKVVELTFSEGDYRVVCVSNGKAAVQRIQESRPDLLLCDVIMPEMNGYEVASFVKKNPAFSAIPVILLTGTFEPFDEEKARQSGADTYITKPFESKMLVEKVEELLRRRPVLESMEAQEPAQVIHSRTEFTLGEPRTKVEAPVAEAVPAAALTPTVEHEFTMPEEALPAHEEPALEELPAAASPFAEPSAVEAAAPPFAEGEAQALLAPAPSPEVVDLGPLPEEAALTDSDFESVLAPHGEAASHAVADVDIPPLLAGEPDRVELERAPEEPAPTAGRAAEASPWDEAAPAAGEVGEAPESISGAEDWGAGQAWGEGAQEVHAAPAAHEEMPELPPLKEEEESPFEVVHDMTDQQEMVSEAQNASEIVGELPSEALPGTAEPLLAPEEGVETILAEVPAQGEPEVATESETTAAVPVVAPTAAAGWSDQDVKQMVDARVAEGLGPGLEAALGAALPAALQRALEQVLPGLVEKHVADMAPDVARRAVQEMAPSLIRQLVDDTAPPLVAGAVRDVIPDSLDEAVREHARSAVSQLAGQEIPNLVRGAAEEHVARQLPAALGSALQERVSAQVRELAPEIIRQVAWEVIPELAESLIKRRIQELESQAG